MGVNGPAGDTVFYRFDASRYGSEGFVDRMNPHSSNVTGSLLWRPSDRGQLRLNVDYLNDDIGSYFGTPLLPRDAVVEPLDVSLPVNDRLRLSGAVRFDGMSLDRPLGASDGFLGRQLAAVGSRRRLNRSSPSRLNGPDRRPDFFHGLIGSRYGE